MIERGIIAGGYVLEGTEDRCVRDTSAWDTLGMRGTRPRKALDGILGHWTASEAGDKDPDGTGVLTAYDDDGPRVYRNMKARLSEKTGKPLQVGIDFVIGACRPEDHWARLWQCADPIKTATVHVSLRDVYSRFIGVEVVSAGRPGPLDVRHRPQRTVRLLGSERTVLQFYPGQLRTWVWLANTLAEAFQFPKQVPCLPNGQILHAERRFGLLEVKRWKGAMEHVLVPGTTKLDGGGMLVQALADAGWARVPVSPDMKPVE